MSDPKPVLQRAIIDIGSNTVRLVVYNGPARAPVVLLNEKVAPKLGRDVAKDGRLSDKSMQLALAALERYAVLLDMLGVENVQTVATAAARDAPNGAEFLRAVENIGLAPRLLSGREEAETSALGVIAAFPGAQGVVGDLGGGSLELIHIGDKTCHGGITVPFGSLRLPDLRAGGAGPFAKTVRDGLKKAGWRQGRGEPFYAVGGSWRALALYAIDALGWPLEDPHGFELAPEPLQRICAALSLGKLDRAEQHPRISSSRWAALPDAAALMGALITEMQPAKVVFSSWGLREGLLYAGLDEATRREDPLIAGVGDFARAHKIEPDTARLVCDWTSAVLPASPSSDGRLRLAAALIALAAMRSEPNMRAAEAVDWALRKRWIGLDTRGRALIAAAVIANAGTTDIPASLTALVNQEDLHWAVACGLAIRLCRKLTGCTERAMAASALKREDGRLVLHLDGAAAALASPSVGKNLRTLADWLGLAAVIEVSEAETRAA